MCDLRSADLQSQGLIKLQFRNLRCIRTCGVRPLITTRLHYQICRLFKLYLSLNFLILIGVSAPIYINACVPVHILLQMRSASFCYWLPDTVLQCLTEPLIRRLHLPNFNLL